MKHVLLIGNIDGNSKFLLKYASSLCNDLNLKLHVLQIEPNNDPIFVSSPYYFNKVEFRINQADLSKRKEIESFIHTATKDVIDAEWVSLKIMRGNIEESIQKFINEEKIDLIIMRQAIFNNSHVQNNEVFAQLFKNVSEVPMLIIPENQLYENLDNFCYFTTFSDDNFNHIQWLAKSFTEKRIELVHFSTSEASAAQSKWVSFLKSEIESTKITHKRLDTTIKDYIAAEINIKKPKFNCVCFTTSKRDFWGKIFDPSTTFNLINTIEVPTLVFKNSTH